MKNTLNKIIYKLVEQELHNSENLTEQNVLQKLKNLFKGDVDNEQPVITTQTQRTDNDEVTINYYKMNPPIPNSKINSKFGWRGGRRHKGVDFAVPTGTNVYAVRPGIVVMIGDQPDGWGNYVVTKHEPIDGIGETFYALYAHLSNVLVSNNEDVDFGTIIGKSGGERGAPGAGNSTGPHLHFEIQLSLLNNQKDPVLFYKKYNQRLENSSIFKSDLEKNKSIDYIVEPNNDSITNTAEKTISTINQSDIASIESGITKQDGFILYQLPDDESYTYGVPYDNTKKYGWWAHNNKSNKWLHLQSHLQPVKYKQAITLLNSVFPNAIDTSNITDTDLKQPLTTSTQKKSIFSKLTKNKIYYSASILKNLNNIVLYQYSSNQFKKIDQVNFDRTDSIEYLGHDTKNQYMHIRIISNSDHPAANQKYWINIKDIKLSKNK